MYQSPPALPALFPPPKRGFDNPAIVSWREAEPLLVFSVAANKMKTKRSENNFKGALGKAFGRRMRRREPLLALNILGFSFTAVPF
jgi:hypothetical protein